VRFPISLGLVALSFLLYGVQHLPNIGIVLLLVGAPLWSILLINGGILGVVVETIERKLDLAWLIIPALWFGGNAALAGYDYLTLAKLRREIAESNEAVKIPFDPAREALVADSDSGLLVRVTDFKLPVSYQAQQNGEERSYLATRLAPREVCDRIRDDPEYGDAGISLWGFIRRSGQRRGGEFDRSFCAIATPENPALPVVRITASTEELKRGAMSLKLRTIAVSKPDGRQYLIKGGSAAPHSWIPLPVMGCTLDSGNPSWGCKIGFLRPTPVPLVKDAGQIDGETMALGNALGLTPLSRFPYLEESDEELLSRFSEAKEQVVRRETQALDAAISDPMVEIGSLPFRSLRLRNDIIVPRLSGMVSAIEHGVAVRQNARSNAQQMFHLVEGAPPDEVEPYMERLKALYAQDSWFWFVSTAHDPNAPIIETVGEPIIVDGRR